MTYGIRLKVAGEYACFTRPEMKVERVSYDVMTPSGARGVLEAVHWKPAIRWIIDRIHVLKPIRFENIRRNEVGGKLSYDKAKSAATRGRADICTYIEDDRQQRASTLLRDVAYVIEAHFELVEGKAGPDDNEGKHLDIFNRRARNGQCFNQPYLGCREFSARFELLEGDIPTTELPKDQRNRDLGWMLHDINFANDMRPMFFKATMKDGVIDVPHPGSDEVKS